MPKTAHSFIEPAPKGQSAHDRLLRLEDVQRKTGMGSTTIYKYMKEEDFPQQIRIGKRMVRWLESEIDAWIQNRAGMG